VLQGDSANDPGSAGPSKGRNRALSFFVLVPRSSVSSLGSRENEGDLATGAAGGILQTVRGSYGPSKGRHRALRVLSWFLGPLSRAWAPAPNLGSSPKYRVASCRTGTHADLTGSRQGVSQSDLHSVELANSSRSCK
jgi:hypothetical protein